MKNGRMCMVYDGKVADDLTKDELIKAILSEYGLNPSNTLSVQAAERITKAMAEAFRCGFLHGEQYGKNS
jgi:hypothetical protein